MKRILLQIARLLMFPFRGWSGGRTVLGQLAAEGRHDEAWGRLKNMLAMSGFRFMSRRRSRAGKAAARRLMAKLSPFRPK